jgi:hypothetical protein
MGADGAGTTITAAADTAPATPPFDEAAWLAELARLNPWDFEVPLPPSFVATLEVQDQIAWLALRPPGQALDPALLLRIWGQLFIWYFAVNADDATKEQQSGLSQAWTDARKVAHLARWRAGQTPWNTWAEGMLGLRTSAEAAQAAGATNAWQTQIGNGKCENPLTVTWFFCAEVDFTEHKFADSDRYDFEKFTFPFDAKFEKAQFGTLTTPGFASFGGAMFKGGASFAGAAFSGIAWFADSTFNHDAQFRATSFGGIAWFHSATFIGDAVFDDAKFNSEAWFSAATFDRYARFGGATFSGAAWFIEATFLGITLFNEATFSEKTYFNIVEYLSDEKLTGRPVRFANVVSFVNTLFHDRITFADAEFESAAIFRVKKLAFGIDLEDTTFARAPDFRDVELKEPPAFDNMAIAHPLSPHHAETAPPSRDHWLTSRMGYAIDRDEHARYRKLRKMAAEAKDTEKEILFNAHEIASRRFWVDEPFGRGAGNFWLGWAYGKLSDYGQSFAQPLVALLGLWLLCFVAYASLGAREVILPPDSATPAADSNGPVVPRVGSWAYPVYLATIPCQPSYEDARKRDAKWEPKRDPKTGQIIYVPDPLTNTPTDKPLMEMAVREQKFHETHVLAEALTLSLRNTFITDRADVSRRMYGCLYGIQDKGGTDYPVIPAFVSWLSGVQSLLSLILLALTGLAIRNRFRVR